MRLGLALSGGAVRGAAHVGALMALENAGLRPAFIAGTSIGALVGALYAAGHPAGDLAEVFAEIGWSSLLGPSLPRKLSLFDVKPMERLLGERFQLTTFEALEIPFAAVACDITAGEEVVLRDGDLTSAVLASCALPGVFPPVERGDRLLVDGGVVNNLPIDVVRRMGADTVIAIDLLPAWRALGAPESLFEVWERSITLLIQGNQRAQTPAEVTVQPALAAFSFTDFDPVEEMITLGRQATELALARAGLGSGHGRV
ncbi:MAG: patatin-like phospholipase family protein [Acidobacteriota bacterium]